MKKNVLYMTLLAGVALLASCESDREDNPVLNHPTTFALHTPEADKTVDLSAVKMVTLSCEQPDYGFSAPAVYSVETSLDNRFEAEKVEVLPTTYTSEQLNLPADELSLAVTNLAIAEGKTPNDFPLSTTIYIRLKSVLRDTIGVLYSNPIALNVRAEYAVPKVTLPTQLYAIGAFCGWNWDHAAAMVPVHSHPDLFWRMVYLPQGGLKFNTATNWNNALGYDQIRISDFAGARAVRDNDGNISVSVAGWYLLVMKAVLENGTLTYQLSFNRPNVYLLGVAADNVWEAKDEYLFTVPTTAEGDFVSVPMKATAGTDDSHIRACVKLADADWWQTEFMVLDGKLEYRAAGGDQTRVGAQAGQRLHINFTKGTGTIQ